MANIKLNKVFFANNGSCHFQSVIGIANEPYEFSFLQSYYKPFLKGDEVVVVWHNAKDVLCYLKRLNITIYTNERSFCREFSSFINCSQMWRKFAE